MRRRRDSGIEIKNTPQLLRMRRAGLVVARALTVMEDAVTVGMTTAEVDAIAVEVLAEAGATSSFLGYAPGGVAPYPAVTCVSVDDEVVHGIPSSERVLADGDLLSIDFGALLDGYHGDAARTVEIGAVSPEAHRLVADTHEALWAGIAAARLGSRIGDISAAVEESLRSHDTRYGIVKEFTGHGIGTAMHQEPSIPNYGRAGRGPVIRTGMALAIEPMVTLGTNRVAILDDDWTVVTTDGSWAAHWEHTITVTDRGVWVLTAEDGGEELLGRHGIPFGPLAD
ncbi:MAG: type I methionyl aminopeptidase [Propionibacteriaceae bacterium]|nr:type I methionyl aminopeptidase [Propionibacteriaceae bacterium]